MLIPNNNQDLMVCAYCKDMKAWLHYPIIGWYDSPSFGVVPVVAAWGTTRILRTENEQPFREWGIRELRDNCTRCGCKAWAWDLADEFYPNPAK